MKYPTSAIKPSEQVSTSKGLCILQNITNIVFKKYGWQPNLVLVPPIYGQRKRSDSNRKCKYNLIL